MTWHLPFLLSCRSCNLYFSVKQEAFLNIGDPDREAFCLAYGYRVCRYRSVATPINQKRALISQPYRVSLVTKPYGISLPLQLTIHCRASQSQDDKSRTEIEMDRKQSVRARLQWHGESFVCSGSRENLRNCMGVTSDSFCCTILGFRGKLGNVSFANCVSVCILRTFYSEGWSIVLNFGPRLDYYIH